MVIIQGVCVCVWIVTSQGVTLTYDLHSWHLGLGSQLSVPFPGHMSSDVSKKKKVKKGKRGDEMEGNLIIEVGLRRKRIQNRRQRETQSDREHFSLWVFNTAVWQTAQRLNVQTLLNNSVFSLATSFCSAQTPSCSRCVLEDPAAPPSALFGNFLKGTCLKNQRIGMDVIPDQPCPQEIWLILFKNETL